jgi:hypothetical protein
VGCSWINFVINDDLVFTLNPKTICKFLPNLIPYFWLSVKSSNVGMKSENWGPFIKIKDEIKFLNFFFGGDFHLRDFLRFALLGTFLMILLQSFFYNHKTK